MSQHPSLRSSDKDKQHRSVLKRYERIKTLKDKEKWDDEKSVFGLPKVKVMRFKIKKEKAAVAAAEGAEATAPTAGAAEQAPGALPAKGQAPAKAQAPTKGQAQKESTKPSASEGKK